MKYVTVTSVKVKGTLYGPNTLIELEDEIAKQCGEAILPASEAEGAVTINGESEDLGLDDEPAPKPAAKQTKKGGK